jgi:hypothetical protein
MEVKVERMGLGKGKFRQLRDVIREVEACSMDF